MSKYHNDVKITSGRRLYVQEPIDDRIVFQSKADVEADVAADEPLRWYEGMQMVLNDEAEIYIWLPVDNLPQSTAILDYSRYSFRDDHPDPLYAGREFAFVRRTYVQLKHSQITLDDGTNPHGTTKADVGLSNVDNTADKDKIVSDPQQAALDNKEDNLGIPSADGQYLASTITGQRYWTTPAQGVPDAPADNTLYARINQAWEQIIALKTQYDDSATGLIQGPSNVQHAIEALVEQINALASGRRFLGVHDADTFPTTPPTGGYLAGDYYIIANIHNIVLPGDSTSTFFDNGDWMIAEDNSGVIRWKRFVPNKSREAIEAFDNTKVYPINSVVFERDVLWANFGTASIQPGAFDPTQWTQLTYSQTTTRPSDFVSQDWTIPATTGDINEWYRIASFDPVGPKFTVKLLLFLDSQTLDIEFVGSNPASLGVMTTVCSDPGITANPALNFDDISPIRGIGIERVSDTEYYIIVQPTPSVAAVIARAEVYIVAQDMQLINPVPITGAALQATTASNHQLVQWIGNMIVGYRGTSDYNLDGYYIPYVNTAGFQPNERPYAKQNSVLESAPLLDKRDTDFTLDQKSGTTFLITDNIQIELPDPTTMQESSYWDFELKAGTQIEFLVSGGGTVQGEAGNGPYLATGQNIRQHKVLRLWLDNNTLSDGYSIRELDADLRVLEIDTTYDLLAPSGTQLIVKDDTTVTVLPMVEADKNTYWEFHIRDYKTLTFVNNSALNWNGNLVYKDNDALVRVWLNENATTIYARALNSHTKLVPDEAARLALVPTGSPALIPDGTLVIQQDTGWTWRYQETVTAGQSIWRVFSDFLTVADDAARDALIPHIHRGTWVGVEADAAVYNWTADPSNKLTDNGWLTVANIPPATLLTKLSVQVFDPENGGGKQLAWVDGRSQLQIVDTISDLSDRNVLPLTHLVQGKLVYVKGSDKIYEFNVDIDNGDTPADDLSDWRDLATAINPPGLDGIIIENSAPSAPGSLKWADLNPARVAATPPGSYFIVSSTETPVPAAVPDIGGNAVKPGDWVVASDTDDDGTSDYLSLVEFPAIANTANIGVSTTSGEQPPTTNVAQGDIFYNSADFRFWVRTATAWQEIENPSAKLVTPAATFDLTQPSGTQFVIDKDTVVTIPALTTNAANKYWDFLLRGNAALEITDNSGLTWGGEKNYTGNGSTVRVYVNDGGTTITAYQISGNDTSKLIAVDSNFTLGSQPRGSKFLVIANLTMTLPDLSANTYPGGSYFDIQLFGAAQLTINLSVDSDWSNTQTTKVFTGLNSTEENVVYRLWINIQGKRYYMRKISGGGGAAGDGLPIGAIIAYPSYAAPPSGYLPCNGARYDPLLHPDLYQLLQTDHLPDFREHFIRGAGSQNQIDGFTKHQDTTRRPRNDFHVNASGNTTSNGNHRHSFTRHGYNSESSWLGGDALWTVSKGPTYTQRTNTTGNHHHSVTVNGTVNGGGDNETVPKHVYMAYYIKAL